MDTIRVGDLLAISFDESDSPSVPIRVGLDRTVGLPYGVTVIAAGKTPRALADDIRNQYVPKEYGRLDVTIYVVGWSINIRGEVRSPRQYPYINDWTVLRAIDSAGGCTELAQRKYIELRRANGEKVKINWYKARRDPSLDARLFPNDEVFVPRIRD